MCGGPSGSAWGTKDARDVSPRVRWLRGGVPLGGRLWGVVGTRGGYRMVWRLAVGAARERGPSCPTESGSDQERPRVRYRYPPAPDPEGLVDAPASVPEPLKAQVDGTKEYDPDIGRKGVATIPVTATLGKLSFLQRERWKAVQEAQQGSWESTGTR